MGSSVVGASNGLTAQRFPAAIGNSFDVPNGITLRNTITSTSTISSLPSQIWVVLMGGGGGGASGNPSTGAGGGGGACIGWMDVPTSGSLTFTIGAGGAGGAFNNDGNHGGRTSVGGLIAWGGCKGAYISQPWDGPFYTFYGPGAGLGGWRSALTFSTTYQGLVYPWKQNAPFFTDINLMNNSTNTVNYSGISNAMPHNYTGGGAGGSVTTAIGGAGLAGGGGRGAASPSAGGPSSRDAGVTNSFTGGTTGGAAGGGGAGLLANGGAGSSAGGGTGGSGGGGGGAYGYDGSNTNGGGAGGGGCALIYY